MPRVNPDKPTPIFDFQDLAIHLAFGGLAVLAAVMYAERMFADASYYLLHMINEGWFHVEHGRLVLAISQILPWIGVKFGLSLKTILILFSIGHVCFFYAIFLVCRYRYGDRGAGLLLILLQTLGLELGYFTPMFELYYGAGFLVLFASILWAQRFGRWDNMLLFLSLLFILTSHPIAVMLWGYVLVLHASAFGRKYVRQYVVFAGGLLIFLGYKFISASAYEETKTLAFFETLRTMPYGAAYMLELARFMLKYYAELMILFVIWLSWMVASRRYSKAIIVLLAFIVMLVIINGAHYGFQHTRYQEQVYFPLSWIVAFPFALSLAYESSNSSWRQLLWVVLFILISLKVIAIINESTYFTNRIDRMERLISLTRSLQIDKAIVGEDNVTRASSAGTNWSYGIETLLLSARDGRDSTVTICLDTDIGYENNRNLLTPEDFLMRKWDIYPAMLLNSRYFRLEPGSYLPLCSPNAIASLDSLISTIAILLPQKEIHIPRGEIATINVIIQNSSITPLPSDSTHVLYLSYHWFNDDEMVVWDGLRTPFEADITGEYLQTMDISSPQQTGHYTLIVDVVAEGRRWFGIDTKRTVWVY